MTNNERDISRLSNHPWETGRTFPQTIAAWQANSRELRSSIDSLFRILKEAGIV
jgi:hypothetical protein